MKIHCSGALALLLWGSSALAASLAATPKTAPDFPATVSVWIGGGDAVNTDIGREAVADSFSGTILRKLDKTPETGAFFAEYLFHVAREGEYEFFAALITQKRAHASPVEFRFDGGAWQEVPNNPSGSPSWGISGAVSWNSLGSFKLKSGGHTLALRITKRAGLGSWSFMCDGVAGFEKGVWKQGAITDFATVGELKLGGKLEVSFRRVGEPFFGEVRLMFGGGAVVATGLVCRPGENSVMLPIPAMLGVGSYTIELAPLDAPEHVLAMSAPLSVASTPVPEPARLAGVELNGTRYSLKFAGETRSAVAAMFFDGAKLYAVARLDEADGTLPEAAARLAAGRTLTVRFMPLPARAGNMAEKTLALPGVAVALPKAVSYGIFTDRDSIAHLWYMNHDHEYILDGQRYFPVGGMWCPDTLISRDNDPAGIARRMRKDLATIAGIKAGGLSDVYLNLSLSAPLWVRQSFVDLLERENIQYGYQLTSGGGAPIPAFFITRDRAGAPSNYRGVARGVFSGGKVVARFPAEQKLAGLLVVDPAAPGKGAEFVGFTDLVGKDLRHGIIDLETQQDFGKLREISFAVKSAFEDGREVLLIPLLEAKMHHSNLWDDQEFAALKERLSWIGRINWGRNLRFFVDPIKNETDMVNGTENLRQYTAGFNAAFAAYLERRYGTVANLVREWGVSADSFAAAARLIPLAFDGKYWWIDPATGQVAPGREDSFAWIDYQDALRETYAALTDDIAVFLKSMVNVPVVFKSVGVIGEKMSVSRSYPGYDGVGFECYLNQGVPGETGGGASRAEAEASEHTMWKVGTEVGHSAAVGNDKVKFFTDEAELRDMAGNLARLGVSGFFFFGFDLKPGDLWNNHNYHDYPAGLAWAARIKHDFALPGRKPVAATPRNYVFPGGFTWWWWTTRYKALFGYEQNLIPQSARLGTDSAAWFSSTNVLPPQFDAVIVNCPMPPFSRYYAPEIGRAIASGRPVYYVGRRADLGAIPGLDRFFTPETIEFPDGSVAQVLNPGKDGRVLAAGNGKAWALRSGNLVIVSRTPKIVPENHSDDFLKYLVEVLRDGAK